MGTEKQTIISKWRLIHDRGKMARINKLVAQFTGYGDTYDHEERFKHIMWPFESITNIKRVTLWGSSSMIMQEYGSKPSQMKRYMTSRIVSTQKKSTNCTYSS